MHLEAKALIEIYIPRLLARIFRLGILHYNAGSLMTWVEYDRKQT